MVSVTVVVATHLAPADAHAAVVELQLLQRVAGAALQQPLDALDAVRPEGVVAEVQHAEPGAGRHQGVAQGVLGSQQRPPTQTTVWRGEGNPIKQLWDLSLSHPVSCASLTGSVLGSI